MTTEARLYHGWRKAKGLGMFGLSVIELATGVGLIMLAMLSVMAAGFDGLKLAGPVVIVGGLLLVPVQGVTLHYLARREVRWAVGGLRRRRSYRSGLLHVRNLHDDDQMPELPGALAATRVIEVTGLWGDAWAIVRNEHTGQLTVTLSVLTQSAWLADEEDFSGWVANWHGFLAATCYEPSVAHVAVSIESSSMAGEVFADQLSASIHPDAPPFAAGVLSDLAARATEASTKVEAWVEITFDPAKGSAARESVDAQAAEVAALIPSLERDLLACGVSSVKRATAAQLGRRLRVAFDPAAAAAAEAAEAQGGDVLLWRDSGPVALDETRTALLHDSGVSVGYVWHEAPRAAVPATVLARLLAAGPWRKRVTLLFEPTAAADGAQQLEVERTAANTRRLLAARSKTDETARNRIDREFTEMAATEEAQGAGLGSLWLFLTVTVEHSADLPDALADIEARAGQCRLRLRRATCSHASVCSVGLGAGVHPARLASLGWRR